MLGQRNILRTQRKRLTFNNSHFIWMNIFETFNLKGILVFTKLTFYNSFFPENQLNLCLSWEIYELLPYTVKSCR